MQAADGIAPYREFRVKVHTEDWFDGEIMERIENHDKLLKKYKSKFISFQFVYLSYSGFT